MISFLFHNLAGRNALWKAKSDVSDFVYVRVGSYHLQRYHFAQSTETKIIVFVRFFVADSTWELGPECCHWKVNLIKVFFFERVRKKFWMRSECEKSNACAAVASISTSSSAYCTNWSEIWPLEMSLGPLSANSLTTAGTIRSVQRWQRAIPLPWTLFCFITRPLMNGDIKQGQKC